MQFDDTTRRRINALLIWLSLAFAGTYLFIFEPGKSGFFPACPFRLLTGLNCPGCGSTRALHRLVHGDVIGAFKFNALMMVVLPFLLYSLARYTIGAIRGRPLPRHYLAPAYMWMLLAVIVGFWVVRNTRFYPFPL